MNFEICKEFKENFYEVHMFNGLSETKLINLKSSWVFKTISKNNKRWSARCLQRFLDTLPNCYQISSTSLYERYVEVAKSNFIEALYFLIPLSLSSIKHLIVCCFFISLPG